MGTSVSFLLEKLLNSLAREAEWDKDLKVTIFSKSHMKIIGQIEKKRPIHNIYKNLGWKWGCSTSLHVIMSPDTHRGGKKL